MRRLGPAVIVLICLCVIVIAASHIRFKRLIRIDVEVSEFTFSATEEILNFFSLSYNPEKIRKATIQAFDRATLKNLDSIIINKEEKIEYKSSDITDKISLTDVSINKFDLSKNSISILQTDKAHEDKIYLTLDNTSGHVSFLPETSQSGAKINGEKFEFDKQQYSEIKIWPKSTKMKLALTMSSGSSLAEEEVLPANKIRFSRNVNEREYSSILKGNLNIIGINKKIDLNKNAVLVLEEDTQAHITELRIEKGRIKIMLEAYTDSVKYGARGVNIVPTALEYFILNNFVIVFLNLVFSVFALSIALIELAHE